MAGNVLFLLSEENNKNVTQMPINEQYRYMYKHTHPGKAPRY